jgi:hypothetical protein
MRLVRVVGQLTPWRSSRLGQLRPWRMCDREVRARDSRRACRAHSRTRSRVAGLMRSATLLARASCGPRHGAWANRARGLSRLLRTGLPRSSGRPRGRALTRHGRRRLRRRARADATRCSSSAALRSRTICPRLLGLCRRSCRALSRRRDHRTALETGTVLQNCIPVSSSEQRVLAGFSDGDAERPAGPRGDARDACVWFAS